MQNKYDFEVHSSKLLPFSSPHDEHRSSGPRPVKLYSEQ